MSRLTDRFAQLKRSEAAGFAFSLTVVSYYFFAIIFSLVMSAVGKTDQKDELYFFLSYAVPSVVLLVSVLIFFKTTKFTFYDFSGIKFRPILIIPTILIFSGAFFALSGVNEFFVEFLSELGYVESSQSLPEYSPLNFVLCLILIGILPPALEETLFRGVILGGVKHSAILAVVISALCFSIYHMNPSRTIYQFLMGALFALVAIRSDSVLPTAIIHSLNNVAIIIMEYFFASRFSPEIKTVTMIVGWVSLALGIALLFVFSKKEKTDDEKPKSAENGRIGGFFAWAAVGIALCVIMWIARLIQ